MAHSVAFDTLAYAKKLESCGIAVKQAEAHAEALADVLVVNFTSKKDLETNYNKLLNKIDHVEASLLSKIDRLDNKIDNTVVQLDNKIDNIEVNLKQNIQQTVNHVKIEIIKWVIGLLFAQTALLLTVLRFFH